MLATSLLPVLIGILAVLIVVLFLGGLYASGRHREALAKRLPGEIEAADAALADARAQDRGWERATMEAAARDALAQRAGGQEIRELHLIQVVDRPGTDQDEALFRGVLADGREESITLGRRDGAWAAV